jgi:hypothetical protein
MANRHIAPWTEEETEYLRKNYGLIPTNEISSFLNRTYNSISSKTIKLKIKKHEINKLIKCCSRCKVIKPVSSFRKRSDARAVRSICKVCFRRDDRNRQLKQNFGIDLNEYNEILKKQKYVCAICNQPETRACNTKGATQELAVDHCHKTQKIRGLLCCNCNTGIGLLKESKSVLENAINYLEKHKC